MCFSILFELTAKLNTAASCSDNKSQVAQMRSGSEFHYNFVLGRTAIVVVLIWSVLVGNIGPTTNCLIWDAVLAIHGVTMT